MPFDYLYILLERLPDSSKVWDEISWKIVLTKRTDLIEKLPDKPWAWKVISSNMKLPLRLVEKYPDKPWAWADFSYMWWLDTDILNKLLKKFIDKPWDFAHISDQYWLDLDVVDKYHNKPWDWDGLSSHRKLNPDIIKKYIDKPWNWLHISHNYNIDISTVINNYPEKGWIWDAISGNKYLTMDVVEKYPDKSWDWGALSKSKNLTMEVIEKFPNKPWNWDRIISNPNFTLDVLLKTLRVLKTWQLGAVLSHKNFNIEKFMAYLAVLIDHEKNRDCTKILGYVASEPIITMDVIKKYHGLPWAWDKVSRNPNFTVDILGELPANLPWNWKEIIMDCKLCDMAKTIKRYLSLHGDVSPEKCPDELWKWVSANENITTEIIKKYIDKPLDWEKISRNENLDPRFIVRYKDEPWSLSDLIECHGLNKCNAAIKIQRFYRKYGAFPRWRRGIEDSNLAILYNPKIKGIKFKEAEENWNDLIVL